MLRNELENWLRAIHSGARKATNIPTLQWPWCVPVMQVIQTHWTLLTHRLCWHCLLLLSPRRTLLDCPTDKASISSPFSLIIIMARQNFQRKALVTLKLEFWLTYKVHLWPAAALSLRVTKTWTCCRNDVAFRRKHWPIDGVILSEMVHIEGEKNTISSGIPGSWCTHIP